MVLKKSTKFFLQFCDILDKIDILKELRDDEFQTSQKCPVD